MSQTRLGQKWTVIAVVVFALALLGLFSCEARSEELRFEVGSTFLKGETPATGMNIRWREQGPVNTDYEIGFRLIGSSDEPGRMDSPTSYTVYGMLVDGFRGVELGFGFAYTNVDNLYHCRFTSNLMAGLDGQQLAGGWNDRLTLRWYHNSSAGSCTPNTGRDVLMIGWRF